MQMNVVKTESKTDRVFPEAESRDQIDRECVTKQGDAPDAVSGPWVINYRFTPNHNSRIRVVKLIREDTGRIVAAGNR